MTPTTQELMTKCPGCGSELPPLEAPIEPHFVTSPACFSAYRRLLARERSDLRCMSVHALTVDAYAVQHPAHGSDDVIRSVGMHLVSLYGQLVLDLPYRDAKAFRLEAGETLAFRPLPPPGTLGDLTVLHPLAAETPEEHVDRVTEWAWSCWRAWTPHHDQVMSWTRRLLGEIPRPRIRQREDLGWWSGARNAILPLPESSGPARRDRQDA